MTSAFSRRLLMACGLLFCTTTQAAAPATLHQQADALRLASSPYWHSLRHDRPARTASGWRSEARNPAFFLSPQGADHPDTELHALLDALYTPSDPADESGNHAAACRFPARAAWLREQLGPGIPAPACPAFMEWQSLIRPHQATLIFASDYLNNPSSMFGHTFLRLDTADQTEDTRLLAYAVNYAANVNSSNPLSFAWNGLTGGYPGQFSLQPYYDKVREYSDMENRDLWEYQLNFTPEELRRLLAHLWELRGVDFPYYFLTRNCSYQLLSLLEIARPGLEMRSSFPVQAIPTDTLRRVLQEPGMLRKLVYRPAAERRLLQDARDNSPAVSRAARVLAQHPKASVDLSAREEAAALETAYDLRYYLFTAGDTRADTRHDLRELLLRRAQIPQADLRTAPVQPAIDPASGHDTARIAIAAGHARDATYTALRLRPAYHDLLDPSGGYRPGAHIDFLDGELRVDDERRNLRLESLKLIDIDSLAPWDSFFHPWSWFFSIGQHQAAIDQHGQFSVAGSHGVAYLDTGAGADVALTDQMECYLQMALTTEGGPALEKGGRAGAGPRAGCLYHAARWRFKLQADSRYHNDIEGMETRTTLQTQFDLLPGQGLRLELGRLQHGSDHSAQAELSWLHYF
jgi:hypothetical protein